MAFFLHFVVLNQAEVFTSKTKTCSLELSESTRDFSQKTLVQNVKVLVPCGDVWRAVKKVEFLVEVGLENGSVVHRPEEGLECKILSSTQYFFIPRPVSENVTFVLHLSEFLDPTECSLPSYRLQTKLKTIFV